MGDFADDATDRELARWGHFLHTPRKPMHLARKNITCRHCGVRAYWQEVIDKKGFPEIKLFAGGKPHSCHTGNPDDFDDLTGADLG